MLYVADWMSNGKITYIANDSLEFVISYVYKNRILKNKTRYQEITDYRDHKIAVVFSGTLGDKTKGAAIKTGVYFYGNNTAYELNSDGTVGKVMAGLYTVITGGSPFAIKGLPTLKAAQQRAYEYLSRSKRGTVCRITYVLPRNIIGKLTKENGEYYYEDLTTGLVRKYVPIKKTTKKVPAPFGL